MRDRSTANFNIIYAALVLIGILIIIASAMNPDENDARIIQNGALSYNKGWEYKNNYMEVYEECTLPLSLDKKGYMNLTVRKKLGRESQDGQYIMYRSVHATNTIYAGKRKIMTYADKQSTFFPLPGSAWIIVPLKDSYQGKYLTINLHRIEPKYGGIMEEVILGDRADMLERILVENIFGVATCAMILFVDAVSVRCHGLQGDPQPQAVLSFGFHHGDFPVVHQRDTLYAAFHRQHGDGLHNDL